MSIAGVSYAALNPDRLKAHAQVVADQASCHTVDTAIVAYAGEYGRAPRSINELRSYVKGDISAYRIVRGVAAGPGC